MTLMLPPSPSKGMYGFKPNVTSWGGQALRSNIDNKYHLFVSEIPGGLREWKNKSQCIHAVGDSMAGTFTKSDVVLAAECHNPSAILDPKSGEWLMFHIGNGTAAIKPASSSSLQQSSSSSASNGFMEHSKSPFGPWTPSATAPEHCNNPAPAYHPNGTLFIICNNFDLVSAPYGWNAEWTKPTSIGKPPPSTDTDRQVAGIMVFSLFCCWCH